MHAASVSANVSSSNELLPPLPLTHPLFAPLVLRRQAPLTVQHWPAILVPSGASVALGDVMQTPSEGSSELPRSASAGVKDEGGAAGVGVTEVGDGDGEDAGGEADTPAGGKAGVELGTQVIQHA